VNECVKERHILSKSIIRRQWENGMGARKHGQEGALAPLEML